MSAAIDEGFSAEEADTRPGILEIVHTLANATIQRDQRDAHMLAAADRIARGVEALVVLQRDHVLLQPSRGARWPVAAWVAIALSCGVLGAALDHALMAPQDISRVR